MFPNPHSVFETRRDSVQQQTLFLLPLEFQEIIKCNPTAQREEQSGRKMDKEEARHRKQWEEQTPENTRPAISSDGSPDCSIRSLHIELLQMILLWGHEGADKARREHLGDS